MARTIVHYLCRVCGGVQSRWMGKCPDCGTWDALEKYAEPKVKAGARSPESGLIEIWAADEDGAVTSASSAAATPLPDIVAADVARRPTGIGEFDRVLGGGLVAGSVVLLGGAPGIGKSTLMLQAAAILAAQEQRVLYVTSEESAFQTKLRAERLFEKDGADAALSELYVLADTNLARIVEQARKVRPAVMVIDSIQMVYKPDVAAAPGAVAQVRHCCTELVCLAKVSGMAIVLVGHVTKDGQLAGPKLLEHLVDVVLSFEGDRHHAHRVVRGIKNRYGTTLEVGLFEMTGRGLEELTDAAAMIDPSARPQPGSVICPAMHGTRCLLVEIQALTATGFLGSARRRTSGVDANRLAMLIAVLEKHGGLRLADQDVFASAVGGLKVVEPAADLALGLAIAGAHYRRAIDPGTAAIGEVGLGGEIRPVHQLEQRMREASRRGFSTLIVPSGSRPSGEGDPAVVPVATISAAVELLAPARSSAPSLRPGAAESASCPG